MLRGTQTARSITSGATRKGLPEASARASKCEAGTQSVPWRDRPHLVMKLAAEVSGISPAGLYKAAHEGRLTFIKSEGRTLVVTESLVALMEQAQPWTAQSNRGAAARAKRAEAARTSLR
ncbi:hypothetical protein ACLBWX_08435 [Methylobacterium sp. M6A4_1b]